MELSRLIFNFFILFIDREADLKTIKFDPSDIGENEEPRERNEQQSTSPVVPTKEHGSNGADKSIEKKKRRGEKEARKEKTKKAKLSKELVRTTFLKSEIIGNVLSRSRARFIYPLSHSITYE